MQQLAATLRARSHEPANVALAPRERQPDETLAPETREAKEGGGDERCTDTEAREASYKESRTACGDSAPLAHETLEQADETSSGRDRDDDASHEGCKTRGASSAEPALLVTCETSERACDAVGAADGTTEAGEMTGSAPSPPAVTPITETSVAELCERRTIAELRRLCEARGLLVRKKERKQVLAERLLA